jgi:TatA/E family protein of Tat protein translocase
MLEDLFKPTHLIAVFLVVALMFPGKLAGLGGALGKSIRDFKKSLNDPDTHDSSGSKPTA